MDKIIDIVKDFISSLKTDKKKLIIVIAVVLVLIFLILPKGDKKKSSEGFGSELSEVFENEYYTASGEITLCGYNFDVNYNKCNDNWQIGFKNNEINYKELITRYNDNLYFNYGPFAQNGGIANIRCNAASEEDEEQVTIENIVFDSLNSDLLAYKQEEHYSEVKLSSDNWKEYFTGLADELKANKGAVIKGYKDSEYVSEELDIVIKACEKLAASDSTGCYITLTLSENEDESYVFTIDSSVDFSSLPDFINENSFDANAFTFFCSINIDFKENSVNTPAGYVYSMNKDSIHGFISSCWDSLFARKEFNNKNTVTIKSDSVTNVIDLGSTTETYQYLFDKVNGCNQGLLIVSTYNKNVLNQYIEKYGDGNSSLVDDIVYNPETEQFSLSFTLSESAINSVNKISTTPNGFAAFLKTAEGVIPIV